MGTKKEIKSGIIESSIIHKGQWHIIVKLNNSDSEKLFVLGLIEAFDKGKYKEGTPIIIEGYDVGTIVSEDESLSIGPLPLFVASKVSIIKK